MSDTIPVQKFTRNALMALRTLAREQPELWTNPDTEFLKVLRTRGIRDPQEGAGLIAANPIRMPFPQNGERIQRTDRHALAFRESIPGMEVRHLTDPGLLAWLSCLHLLEYGIMRWPLRGEQKLHQWILQHFLSGNQRDMSNSNVAGRPLWLSEISIRAAQACGGVYTAQEVLDHYAGNTESYHVQNEFQALRAQPVMSAYTQTILGEARGISGTGAREIARDLNRAAGARLLDVVSRKKLREITRESTERVMSDPKFVTDGKMLRTPPAIQVLSLGAGVQSTCLALMAEQGYEGMEKPSCAIFADTGWEPPAVYRHLEWLKNELSYPVHVVSAGNIRDDLLEGHTPTGRNFIAIPVYTVGENGREGMGKRQCTSEYKLKPIFRKIRKLLEIPPGRRAPKGKHAEVWIGITTDEAERAKPSREEYISNRHPFLEMGVSRNQLINWFHRNYPGRELPRSACIGCPYRSDAEWKDLRDRDPDSFDDAAFVDDALRRMPNLRTISRVEMFLSNRRIPIRELNLDRTSTTAELHRQECEGMCWI